MKSWGCGEVGWLKRNTVNMKVVSIWFSWNHDYNKRWEDFPKSCPFTEPAGTFYSGNRHTQAASTVGIYAWFISTVAITQGCSPHGTSYLTSVKNWSNYVCLKCSHFKTSFPVMRRRQLWLISDHRCRTPTVCLPSEPAAIWHLRCFFFLTAKAKILTFNVVYFHNISFFSWMSSRFTPLGIKRAACLFKKESLRCEGNFCCRPRWSSQPELTGPFVIDQFGFSLH